MTTPSHQAFVPFVSVDNMLKLVLHLGIERVLTDLAAEIEADFRRWPLFDRARGAAGLSGGFPVPAGKMA